MVHSVVPERGCAVFSDVPTFGSLQLEGCGMSILERLLLRLRPKPQETTDWVSDQWSVVFEKMIPTSSNDARKSLKTMCMSYVGSPDTAARSCDLQVSMPVMQKHDLFFYLSAISYIDIAPSLQELRENTRPRQSEGSSGDSSQKGTSALELGGAST